jgi:aminomethyltransferase
MSPDSASATELRRTPLWSRHVAAGARMVPFAGWEMPVQYSGLIEEHRAVRGAAGLFDVSHMGEFAVRGTGAEAFLQGLLSNDVRRLRDGRAQYQLLLRDDGGILDDLLVYRRAAGDYLLVVNAGAREADWAWIADRARGLGTVDVTDRSDGTALVALQGPAAAAVLQPLTDLGLDGIGYYGHAPGSVVGRSALVSRTGYTGEDGFELYLDPEDAVPVWDALLEQGAAAGLRLVGLGARDTLRLEAGMLLAGQDFDAAVAPHEVGLDWAVKLDKGEFVGRAALEQRRLAGIRRRLVGFGMEGKGIARAGYPARLAAAPAETAAAVPSGVVTSGTWSPTFERAIGLARLEAAAPFEQPAPGDVVQIEVRGREVAARVEKLPFYRRPRT